MKLEPTAAIDVLTIEPAGNCVIRTQFKGRLAKPHWYTGIISSLSSVSVEIEVCSTKRQTKGFSDKTKTSKPI